MTGFQFEPELPVAVPVLAPPIELHVVDAPDGVGRAPNGKRDSRPPLTPGTTGAPPAGGGTAPAATAAAAAAVVACCNNEWDCACDDIPVVPTPEPLPGMMRLPTRIRDGVDGSGALTPTADEAPVPPGYKMLKSRAGSAVNPPRPTP